VSNTLDIDRIVSEVVKKLYLRFGVKVLIVIDRPPQPEDFKRYIQSFNIPWVTFNLLVLNESLIDQKQFFEKHDLIIGNVYGPKDVITPESFASDYSYLILSDLNITESEAYASFSFDSLKSNLVFHFLKKGKDVYYFSRDLIGCDKSKASFASKLTERVNQLETFGIQMISPTYKVIEGLCDLNTLKKYEGETVMLAKNTVLSPLAMDYIKTGAVKVIRK
jgi:hypothetical protein